MKKKVGIITFHNAHNYGAVIQGLALKTKIQSLGYEVEFIQSNDSYIQNHYKVIPSKNSSESWSRYTKRLVHFFLDIKRNIARFRAFERFIEKELPSVNISNVKKKYDYVVLGSDQVWNSNITNGFDPLFFGYHENLDVNKVISYAGSMGNATSEEYLNDEFFSLLANIDAIGVRENKLKELIFSVKNIRSTLTLDPTLLLDEKVWKDFSKKITSRNKYILVYQVYNSPVTDRVVDFLSKKHGLEVKVLSSAAPNIKMSSNVIATASPNDYLNLFANADFVVTTSFHGTVFSIINDVPFYTVKINPGVDQRSSNLLNELGISERHISSLDDLYKMDENINYFEVKEKLNKMRKDSESYLKASLDAE
ncbi:polysaccharide pyruvyl transferase family protein [Vibrio splendidus]|uniref:polysaccharide pyruvyl transferase family protein n=1 Tax=Vibrio splendidus TaxID=29497 RepID=UPI00076AC976|nr:polysaccharide pyruvyl transferase family protein [Vibrio splendidus]